MASTEFENWGQQSPPWRLEGHFYYSRNQYFRKRFGVRVRRISIDAGLDCPNRDGSVAAGGCIFCDPESFSPSRRRSGLSITQQIDEGIRQACRESVGEDRFVAYFQPATNTYGPLTRLREVYQEALQHPYVVGLIIGTRPDCVPEAVLSLLEEFSRRTWLLVEYGLQSIHQRSLEWMNRGHSYAAALDCIERSRRRGLQIGVHVILGLPGESRDDQLETARELARLEVDAVKIHNLHAVRHTPLAELVTTGAVNLPGLEEYVGRVVDFLEELPGDCVIDRLSGGAPAKYLIGPTWCLDKGKVHRAIEAEFRGRGTWQGRRFRRAAQKSVAGPDVPTPALD